MSTNKESVESTLLSGNLGKGLIIKNMKREGYCTISRIRNSLLNKTQLGTNKRLFLVILLLFFSRLGNSQEGPNQSYAPSQLGFSGLIYTPSAYINEWKSVDIGFTHFSKSTSFTYQAKVKSERAFITNLVFLPRVSLSVKLTRPYSNLRPGYQPGNGQERNWGIGDRSLALQAQILKEKKNRPALAIGIQDPKKKSAFFSTNYLVLSKSILTNQINFSANMGYGFFWDKSSRINDDYLRGIFGGVIISWKYLSGIMEYDTQQLNLGICYTFKKFFFLNIAVIDSKYFSGNVSCRFSLN